jgi:hypothetical protein
MLSDNEMEEGKKAAFFSYLCQQVLLNTLTFYHVIKREGCRVRN